MQNNKECKINFNLAEFDNIPKEAVDLLKNMLQPDPEKRYSAAQCLEHEFFKDKSSDHKFLIQDSDPMDEYSTQSSKLGDLKDKYAALTQVCDGDEKPDETGCWWSGHES